MSDYQQISINHHKYNYELDPDLIFNFDSQVIEYVYTEANRVRETNDTITLKALNSLENDSPELQTIESVLCCKTNQDPYLLIICSDDSHNNYMFSHNVKTKVSKAVEYNKPIKGAITHTDMTCSPFTVAYVDRINTIDTKPSFAMVIGTKKDDATLVLLALDSAQDVMQVELTETFKTVGKDKPDIGHITAICILTADKGDRRMGHSDPQILLGFSQGTILIYRIRAHVYSYTASRIRVPVDLSEFTEFPGYPITQLSCARSYNSLLMNVALAQEKPDEIKYQYRRSYIKVVETRGDFTRRQRAIINPPENIQSHAKILETKLIPSTTTLEDSTLQLSIIFQNGDRTYDLNIWEVSPTKISQALVLAMDQQSCIDTMAKSETVKLLKLDTNGYLNHVPQKIADIILEENEDDDTQHTAATGSTSHSVVNEDVAATEDGMAPENAATTDQHTEKSSVTDQDMTTFDEPLAAVDQLSTEASSVPGEIETEEATDTLENIIEDLDEIEQDQHTMDVAAAENITNVESNDKRKSGDATAAAESNAKRQKLHDDKGENEANSTVLLEENLAVPLQETTTLVAEQASNAIVDSESVEEEGKVAAIIEADETHTLKVSDEVQEQQSTLQVTVVENVVLQEPKQEDDNAIDDNYMIVDGSDTAQNVSPTDQRGDDEISVNSMDEDTLVEHDASMYDDVLVDQSSQAQADKVVNASQTTVATEDHQDEPAADDNAQKVDQMVIEEEEKDTDMQSREIEMLGEDQEKQGEEHLDYGQDEDQSGDLMDNYADQAGDASEMFNQVAYDAFQKQEPTTMTFASSEDEDQDIDELDEDQQEQPISTDAYKDQDSREASYLEEGDDEIHDSDALDKDPIQDKDLLNKEDNIKFVSGGELLDMNAYSNSSTPQQQPPPQPNAANTIDYIPVRAEDLLKLLTTEQDTASDHMDVDDYTTAPSHTPITQPKPAEAKPKPMDENEEAYTTMLDFCFGTTHVDLDTLSQSDIDDMGSYCWHHNNIQLKMFMVKYCLLHQMHDEGFLMARASLRQCKKTMTKEEQKECIALKNSMKVDPSVQVGDVFNPFSGTARQKMAQQKQDYLKKDMSVDFYESRQGQAYLDYYTTGSI